MRPPAGVCIAALVAALGGCDTSPHPPARLAQRHLLADQVAAAHGLPEAPAATIGDVTRYVLGDAPVVLLYPTAGSPPRQHTSAAGTLALALRCPPALRGRPVMASTHVTTAQLDAAEAAVRSTTSTHTRSLRCPDDSAAPVALDIAGLPPHARVSVSVRAVAPTPRRLRTGWVEIGPQANLRLAVGAMPAERGIVAARLRLRVRAEAPDGRHVTLLRRTLHPQRRPADAGWNEVAIALAAAHAALGDRMRLVFDSHASEGTTAAWGDPVILDVPGADGGGRRRNLVVISVDTLRADRLGCYGADRPTSPAIDRFAGEGTLFTNAVAPADWTLPSHATLFTGVHPCVHGLETPQMRALPRGLAPLAETLRRAGWSTAAFTEDAYMDPIAFQRGFGSYQADAGVDFHRPRGHAAETMARGRRWIAARAREPFFLFLHTYQVHWPYEPPPGYRELFGGDVPGDDLRRYDAEVRLTDDAIGSLLAGLDELGLAGETLVVITSDHGEAFGEHGIRRHGTGLYEEQLRVPFIWRAPGSIEAGARRSELVGLLDLVPTVLDLFGLPPAPHAEGRSLSPLLVPAGGEPASGFEGRVLFARSLGGSFAVRGGDWKLLFRPGHGVRRFALDVDPGERSPLAAARVTDELRRRRAEHRRDCERLRALVGTREAAPPPGADAERDRKLRALGYVE